MIYFFPTIYMDRDPACPGFRYVVHSKDKNAWVVSVVKQLCPGVWITDRKCRHRFRDHPCNFTPLRQP